MEVMLGRPRTLVWWYFLVRRKQWCWWKEANKGRYSHEGCKLN